MTDGKRPLALVTGASSGIGLELARQFLTNGFDTVMVADGESIREAARSLDGLGGTPIPLQIDLAARPGSGALQSAVSALSRPLEAVAINAGIGVGGPFVETDLSEELRTIDLNVTSTVAVAKWVARDMVARGAGRILFTSSIIARTPAPFQAIYGASKAFVQSFAWSLRNELMDTGVSVTILLPGPTETPFFEKAELLDTKVGTDQKDDPAQVAEQGFKALMKGEGNVLGGSLKSRTMGLGSNILPDALGAAFGRRLSEPGTGDDDAR
ncbi:SDR family oxidoreductase [Paenarthrobacter aurescens]|uniref:Oxidoreductase n=1 Tax=Paenarthrobacter aurescens TaxID=43663 RepID=A0A4Y3NBN2_PAEAU|nr:SDR family NAD(P)-dependent oxidoreductase [Paenarthrobacter aurescens]MDO6141874.1 SDR family NAD(P)-dependent oxidoreductase [Paenarthrobacter aurescens]MDO6145679.1 SDR family NAD(P)-dependent oxidoreductase [Paenarthrobacter aurescens]MDO6156923.1 SDR family NAD(P)-dependent oxidoreductase [Paenarthrobacter aurescens]MDO6160909.1 SDR family NAD(P)-dependent oxidoreductase [Paenarthrobacter aurescens]GEB19082.1 oxidoreductase [Paenarthrobacter aurescens]